MTQTQLEALRILRDYGPLRPTDFARHLWGDDHPGWNRRGKAGPHGATHGVGLKLAAGGYVGKLYQKGWVEPVVGTVEVQYKLSREGRRVLKEQENHHDHHTPRDR